MIYMLLRDNDGKAFIKVFDLMIDVVVFLYEMEEERSREGGFHAFYQVWDAKNDCENITSVVARGIGRYRSIKEERKDK